MVVQRCLETNEIYVREMHVNLRKPDFRQRPAAWLGKQTKQRKIGLGRFWDSIQDDSILLAIFAEERVD
jgi:hypothetical protein